MPLNILRLNHQASSHPNERIVFIKPLQRPESEKNISDTADTFLRAIAAQCLPIMKSHFLSVTTLEEYEPNPEFIGRNFNNGEIIQLVLRSKSGGWVPFNMVQMVMMHELAHNSHMNHGKGFWATRNKYSEELKALWAKGYTGEGFWGGGRCLDDLTEVTGNNAMTAGELGGVQVCGGTFRSRRRKRKRAGAGSGEGGQELTWKEKRDRRIEKKFGRHGQSLGEDEGTRLMLEIGRKGNLGTKPRVAQSKRGRELRAAAALARFQVNEKEADDLPESENTDGATDEEYEETDKGEDATDVKGRRLLDSSGSAMVRVCEGEDADDVQVKHEMAELEGLNQKSVTDPAYMPRIEVDQVATREASGSSSTADDQEHKPQAQPKKRNPLYDIPQYRGSPTPPPSPGSNVVLPNPEKRVITIKRLKPSTKPIKSATASARSLGAVPPASATHVAFAATPHHSESNTTTPSNIDCPICSLSNDRMSSTCMACAHVLDPRKDPRHWKCASEDCRESLYLNAGDAGVCGVCATRRPV